MVGKTFHLITNTKMYIYLRAIFVLEKGGRASIGYRASIGTYTVDLAPLQHNLRFVSIHQPGTYTAGYTPTRYLYTAG